MISQSISYLEKLSVLFMAVGRSAPRYQAMAVLYPRSKKLQAYLCEYFIIVVQLCHKTTKFAQKSALAQISSTVTDSDIKRFQSELELWASSIKEEVTLLTGQKIEEEAQESSRFRTLVLKSSSSASYQKKLEARIRWLDACSTYDYETSWKQARKRGNTAWFINEPEYQQWKDSPFVPFWTPSNNLFVTGKLGSGKTILMANMVDDLILTKPKGTVAYFFCRYDISESLKARTIIGCLARHLLQQSPNIDKLDGALGIDKCVPNSDSVDKIIEVALSDKVPPHYLVLDGLDECEIRERQSLVSLLGQLWEKFQLIICISFRTDTKTQPILGLQAKWTLKIPDNNPDIEEFIEAELEARIESGSLLVGNPVIILEIQDALQAGAQGM
jgi:Cdc6-like AAA superfamily ATPase